jgi:hypothetical protein
LLTHYERKELLELVFLFDRRLLLQSRYQLLLFQLRWQWVIVQLRWQWVIVQLRRYLVRVQGLLSTSLGANTGLQRDTTNLGRWNTKCNFNRPRRRFRPAIVRRKTCLHRGMGQLFSTVINTIRLVIHGSSTATTGLGVMASLEEMVGRMAIIHHFHPDMRMSHLSDLRVRDTLQAVVVVLLLLLLLHLTTILRVTIVIRILR